MPIISGSSGGTVTSITATDPSIVVTGTAAAPTLATGTLDVIAAQHAPVAAVAFNSQRASGVGAATGASDATILSQLSDRAAVACGYVGWTYAPPLITSSSLATSGVVYLVGLWLPPGQLITNVVLNIATAPSGTGPTAFYVGIAVPTSNGTMKAQSNDVKATVTGTGMIVLPLNATYTTATADSATGLYYIVILQNGTWSVSSPVFGCATLNATSAAPVSGSARAFATGATTGRTTLPSNGAVIVGGLTSTSSLGFYAGVT